MDIDRKKDQLIVTWNNFSKNPEGLRIFKSLMIFVKISLISLGLFVLYFGLSGKTDLITETIGSMIPFLISLFLLSKLIKRYNSNEGILVSNKFLLYNFHPDKEPKQFPLEKITKITFGKHSFRDGGFEIQLVLHHKEGSQQLASLITDSQKKSLFHSIKDFLEKYDTKITFEEIPEYDSISLLTFK